MIWYKINYIKKKAWKETKIFIAIVLGKSDYGIYILLYIHFLKMSGKTLVSII